MYQEFAEIFEAQHWWFVGRRRIVADLLASSLPSKRALRILDIGCGTGGMIPVLSEHGRVTAVDGAEQAIEYSRQRYARIAELIRVDFPDQMPPGKNYDLVTLFDVLEHLEDDGQALKLVHDLLAEGGTLLVTVPAHPFLWSPHDEINRHQRRYIRRELNARILQSGLVLKRISFFNTFLFPWICASRFLRRSLAHDGERRSDFQLPHRWLNRGLANLFGAERFLLRHFDLPVGVSLIALAEKQSHLGSAPVSSPH